MSINFQNNFALDDPVFRSRHGRETRLNSSKNVQTASGVHPTPSLKGVGEGGLSRGIKWKGRETDQLHLHPVPRVRLGGAVPPFILYGFMVCMGTSLPFLRKTEDSLIQ